MNELRLLDPPEGMADEFDEWLGLRNEMTTAMRDVLTAGTLHDEPAIQAGLKRVDAALPRPTRWPWSSALPTVPRPA